MKFRQKLFFSRTIGTKFNKTAAMNQFLKLMRNQEDDELNSRLEDSLKIMEILDIVEDDTEILNSFNQHFEQFGTIQTREQLAAAIMMS